MMGTAKAVFLKLEPGFLQTMEMKTVMALTAILVVVFALWVAFPAKIECSYDGTGHIAQAWFYKDSLQSYLKVPWTNPRLWAGSSFLVLHPPLFYAIAALVSFFSNPVVATKIVMFLSYVLAFYSAYLLAREYGLDGLKGAMAGMVYAFSAWHLFSTFFRAAYPDAFGYALFPLPFLYLKRGLGKNMVPFVVSSALLMLSHQAMAMYALPAIAVYYWLLPGRKKMVGAALALLSAVMLFFFVPLLQLAPETGHSTGGWSGLVFDGGPSFPLNLVIPQWGIRYGELYNRFMPYRPSSNASYVGILHFALFAAGLLVTWRKFPELSGLVALSFGFFLGIIPGINPHAVERVLPLFNVPLAVFAAIGFDHISGIWKENAKSMLVASVLIVNAAGFAFLLWVYSVRSALSLPVLPALTGGLALSMLLTGLYMKKKLPFAAIIVAILVLEVLPNAFNPTAVFPTASQVDPCQYPAGDRQFLTNPRGILCPASCGSSYMFQNNGFEVASKPLAGYWSAILPDTSKCPPGLGALGVRYCFQQGKVTELEPAPFVSSTSEYRIVRTEPDDLVLDFERAGSAIVRLGYFSFYRAFSEGRELTLIETQEGFMRFDHPSGLVELKVVPPRSFLYSYLVSALAGLALFASGVGRGNENTRLEWLLLLGLLVILAHISIRLFWMVA